MKDLNKSDINLTRIESNRPPIFANIFEEDDLLAVPRLGQAAAAKLNKLGITRVSNLTDLPDISFADLCALGIQSFTNILNSADFSLPGASVFIVTDYWKTDNPYLAKYGDEWETKTSCTVSLFLFVCITTMIKYILKKYVRVMHMTRYEDDWFSYHDALS